MTREEAQSRAVHKMRQAAFEDARLERLSYRVRILPVQLENAREKVRRLEREAIELGMGFLVERAA